MTEGRRILFLADAGSSVGGGHVMRCLTLAQALTRAGAACGFLATPAAKAVIEAFAGAPVRLFPPGDAESAGELAAAAAGAAKAWPAAAIVADHYGLRPKDETLLAAASPRLLILDDLRRRHPEGLVLDSNLARKEADYPGRPLLAGPSYALVRPEFAALREAALARRAAGGKPRRVLVSLGLTDAGAITGRVVRALLPVAGDMTLDVVIGSNAASRRELEERAAAGEIALHVDARDMGALIAAADIAVGAGGSSVWERCCLGLPSVTVIVADNQRENTEALERAAASLTVAPPSGDFDKRLTGAFSKLVLNTKLRTAMSAAAAALCDGLGADRVAARLLEA